MAASGKQTKDSVARTKVILTLANGTRAQDSTEAQAGECDLDCG